jgi:hypothetical protein
MSSVHDNNTVDQAQKYINQGFYVVPIPKGTKAPKIKGWESKEFNAQDFTPDGNIGLKPQNGLVDIDLDTPEAVEIAPLFLPDTDMVSGHTGSPRSHYWYRSGNVKTVRHKDVNGDTLVEIRSGNLQTVVYPSIHPQGHQYQWHGELKPTKVDPEELEHATALIASTTLLARHWPRGEGSGRHGFALGIAGFLAKGGLDEDKIEQIVSYAAELSGDEEVRDREKAVTDTIRNMGARNVKGSSVIVEFLGEETGKQVIGKLSDWLHLKKPDRERKESKPTYEPVLDNEFTLFSEIEEKPLHWLWEGYIPLGMLTGLTAMPDMGKSAITVDLAARITNERPMPDGTKGLDGGVVMISIEDDASRTIKPRLRVAGADMSRVVDLSIVKRVNNETGEVTEHTFTLPDDLPILERAIRYIQAKIVIIDPLMAVLSPRLHIKNDQETRQALTPLAHLAEETGAAIFILRHNNKGSHSDPLMMGAGNLGISGAYRSELMVLPDPDDEEIRVFGAIKHNLSKKVPALKYSMECVDGMPHIKWLGENGSSIREMVRNGSKPSEGRMDILRVLQEAEGEALTPKEIGEQLGGSIPGATVRTTLSRMVGDGQVVNEARGKYRLPYTPPTTHTTTTTITSIEREIDGASYGVQQLKQLEQCNNVSNVSVVAHASVEQYKTPSRRMKHVSIQRDEEPYEHKPSWPPSVLKGDTLEDPFSPDYQEVAH